MWFCIDFNEFAISVDTWLKLNVHIEYIHIECTFAIPLVFIVVLWYIISISGCFIVIQYRLAMFCSSLLFRMGWALVVVYWYFLVLIMEHFVIKPLSTFCPLYISGFDLDFLGFYCLQNGRVQGGRERVWRPPLFCRGKKNRRERQEEKIWKFSIVSTIRNIFHCSLKVQLKLLSSYKFILFKWYLHINLSYSCWVFIN